MTRPAARPGSLLSLVEALPVCSYAGCGMTGALADDGWDFCLQHYLEHRADLHGEPWPKLNSPDRVLRDALAPTHGTAAAARAHYRRGEKPCQPCMDAARRAKYPSNPSRVRGSWSRPVAS